MRTIDAVLVTGLGGVYVATWLLRRRRHPDRVCRRTGCGHSASMHMGACIRLGCGCQGFV